MEAPARRSLACTFVLAKSIFRTSAFKATPTSVAIAIGPGTRSHTTLARRVADRKRLEPRSMGKSLLHALDVTGRACRERSLTSCRSSYIGLAGTPLISRARQAVGAKLQRRLLATTATNCTDQADGQALENALLSKLNCFRLSRHSKFVASVELNRPKSKNAFSLEAGDELVGLLTHLDSDPTVRCVVLSGNGPDFTSGVDLKSFMLVYGQLQDVIDVAHKARMLRKIIERFQAPFKALVAFGKPIVCVQHGLCLGLGMELAACSDIRYCSIDARMAIREVLIGIAADVGSLQLMPRLSANQSLLNELIYSGRYITVEEALNELKFVSRVCKSKEAAMGAAFEMAATIARRSPVAVQGSKRNLQFSREHSFQVGLDYNAVWNSAMMQGSDVVKAVGAIMSKEKEEEVDYENL